MTNDRSTYVQMPKPADRGRHQCLLALGRRPDREQADPSHNSLLSSGNCQSLVVKTSRVD